MRKILLLFTLLSNPIIGQTITDSLAKAKKVFIAPVANKLAVVLKFGTTGISPELSYRVNSKINVRASFSIFNYKRVEILNIETGSSNSTSTAPVEKAKMQYDASVKLGNFGILVDFFPFKKRVFALNAGVFYNTTYFSVDLQPKSNLNFNDRVFTPEETGTLELKVKYPTIAPYLGLSLGNPNTGKRLKFLLDLGVMYTGSPLIEMQGTGSIEPTAGQAAQLQTNLKPIYLYPVLKFGLSYPILK